MSLSNRYNCPCCKYPTLQAIAAFEICELCNWEDDGQNDLDADEVRGGPNSDYSLSEARLNFQNFRVMYSSGRDQRIIGGDSPLEFTTKGHLMEAFEKYKNASLEEKPAIENQIPNFEKVLRDELNRKIREWERKSLEQQN